MSKHAMFSAMLKRYHNFATAVNHSRRDSAKQTAALRDRLCI